jgi:hypothetical protein
METALRAIAYSARGVSRGAWRLADRAQASRTYAIEAAVVVGLITLAIVLERTTRNNEH